jgi:hypothetical protein
MGNKLPLSLHKSHLILKNKFLPSEGHWISECKEVLFAGFFSSEFITAIQVNPLERTKRTSVQCVTSKHLYQDRGGGPT